LPHLALRAALTRTPGARARSTPWDKDRTLSRNYKALGLACDPNEAHGRVNPVKRAAEEEGAEPTLGELAQTDQEGLRLALGQHLPRGQRPARRLTATQLVRRARHGSACFALTRRAPYPPQRVMGTLVEAHGDDVVAMARDIKRNSLQHTTGTLRVLLAAFHAHRGGGRHEFRAPKKRL